MRIMKSMEYDEMYCPEPELIIWSNLSLMIDLWEDVRRREG